MQSVYLQSIQVGKPQSYGRADAVDPFDKPCTTAFNKLPREGKIFAGKTNLAGDGQANTKHHGGIDKAVLAYCAEHYAKWRQELGLDMTGGAFGENLTIAGLDEKQVFIGDVFRIGPVTFEVSQPRQPCSNLARRWALKELVGMVLENSRSGWYMRVLEEGYIEKGMPVVLLARPNPSWSVKRANRIMNHFKHDLLATMELAAVPKLSESWVKELKERAQKLHMPADQRDAQAAPGVVR